MNENDVRVAQTQAANMQYSLDALHNLSKEAYQNSVGRTVEVNNLKMVGDSVVAKCTLEREGTKMLKEIA